VSLPTSDGRENTVAGGLIDWMDADPSRRVLSIAHQQELVEQSISRFRALGSAKPRSFRRLARIIPADADSITLLADPNIDAVATTYQSLLSRGRGPAQQSKLLRAFLARPTIRLADRRSGWRLVSFSTWSSLSRA
jgi:hypothetical protein